MNIDQTKIIERIIKYMDMAIADAMEIYEHDDFKLVCKSIWIREKHSAFYAYNEILEMMDKEKAMEIREKYKMQIDKMNNVYWKAITKLKEG